MKGKLKQEGVEQLREMSERIEEIERLVFDQKELGKGMPVIEKNACSIPSLVYALKLGISDVAEIIDERRH